ncbi:hypothetical protein [Paraburkholderia sp. DGU8]|uniref:hypothetical protein n=1 Tax=Paraburkholderia sp. DGU8 TaxID=3161997 RepID=UPI0034671E63
MQINLKTLLDWFPGLRGILEASDSVAFDEYLERHIEQCISEMEAEAHHLNKDCEEKLSAYLAASLRHPGLCVRRESYSNGRVDLTIWQEGVIGGQQRLAEAKIYNGPAYHTKALEQLIKRYSTGRMRTGYVFEYVKNQGIATLVKGLREHADKNKPLDQRGDTAAHGMKWAYESRHMHSSDDLFRVVHVSVNLFNG